MASSETTITWLHLSDYHAGQQGQAARPQVDLVLERSIRATCERLGQPDLLLFTGDMAFRGAEDEYKLVDDLLERINIWVGRELPVFAVPGNHDLVRPKEDAWKYDGLRHYEDNPNFRKALWAGEVDLFEPLFADYRAWASRRIFTPAEQADRQLHISKLMPGDFSAVFEKDGFRLGIVGLNSTWVQYDGGDFEGKLQLPPEQFHAALPPAPQPLAWFENVDASLLLTHQPRSWLTPSARESYHRDIHTGQRFDLALFGHMHVPESKVESLSGTRPRAFFQAPSLFGLEHYGDQVKESRVFGYAWGRVSSSGELRVWPKKVVSRGDRSYALVDDQSFEPEGDPLGGVVLRRPRLAIPPAPTAPPPAERLGWPNPLRALELSWHEWSRATTPACSVGLVMAGRDDQREALIAWLSGPANLLPIHASDPGEVAAFCWAALGRLPEQARHFWRKHAVVVFGDDELRLMNFEGRQLLLVARECSYEVARSRVVQGHHVILANSTTSQRDVLILGSLEPQRAQLELKFMGYLGDPYELVKRLRGPHAGVPGVLMAAIRRELGGCDDELPPELAPLCLVGGWTDREDDLKIVCQILGEDAGWLRDLLRRHSGGPAETLVRSGVGFDARWRWASRPDAWRQLAPRLTSDELGRFERVVIEVIGETHRGCSDELRHGLLEGLALLAIEPHSGRDVSDRSLPERVVGRLLFPPRAETWAALAGALSILAEVAPETFLRCAEFFVVRQLEALGDNERALRGLVAALELLAWPEEWLFRVTDLLAAIAVASANALERVLKALRDIYLPSSPNTAASAQARSSYLDRLANEHPELAVELMVKLLSTRSREVSRGPKYRDWTSHKPETTQVEADAAYYCIWDRLVGLARDDGRHWLVMFPRVLELSPDHERQAVAITTLSKLDARQLNSDEQEELRQQLRATIHDHRQFCDAGWSLPEPELVQLEILHEKLAPKDLRDALAWVFAPAPRLLHPSPGYSFDRQSVQQAQRAAAGRLDAVFGRAELVALAGRVGDPWGLGYALASLVDSDEQVLKLLRASMDNPHDGCYPFRRGLGWTLYKRGEFAAWRNEAFAALPDKVKAELLLGYPSKPSTWDFAELLSPDVAKAYWLGAAALFPHDHDDLERVVRSLVRVGRVRDATALVAKAQVTSFGSLNPEFVVELLDATLGTNMVELLDATIDTSIDIQDLGRLDGFLISGLLKQLRAEGERWRDELLRFEWRILPILDFHHGDLPHTLYDELARRPEYFSEIVRLANPTSKLSDDDRANWERARALLHHWSGLPGRRSDGTLDVDKLRGWVQDARTLLRDAGYSEWGDQAVGEVLANSPEGTDGRWPHEAVREIFEGLGDADHVRRALVTARGNGWSNGLVDIERDRTRAKKLHDDADTMRIHQPRMARVLKELALRSESDAQLWSGLNEQRFDWTSPVTTKVRVDRALDQLEADRHSVFDLEMLPPELGDLGDLLFVLGRHRRVATISNDVFVIVPHEYRRRGAPPPSWYLDELMLRADTNYCVGLLSAAALHGAVEQPQVVQVLVDRATETMTVGSDKIDFVVRERGQSFDTKRVDAEGGAMAIATVEATIFDLTEFVDCCGGRDAVVHVLRTLAEEVDTERVLAIASAYPPEIVLCASDLLDNAAHGQLAGSLRGSLSQ